MKRHLTVVAACIADGEEVFIYQRNAGDAFGMLWEFPGGKVEDNEELPEAIIREIREEVGVRVSIDKKIGTFEDENETLKITVYLFKARIAGGSLRKIDCRDFCWTTIDKLGSFNLAPVDKKIARFLQENGI